MDCVHQHGCFFNFIAKGLRIRKLPDLGEKKGMRHNDGQEP